MHLATVMGELRLRNDALIVCVGGQLPTPLQQTCRMAQKRSNKPASRSEDTYSMRALIDPSAQPAAHRCNAVNDDDTPAPR